MKYRPEKNVDYQLNLLLNNGLEFGDNFNAAQIEVTTTGAEQRVEHNLGSVPNGFILLFISGEANVWGTRLEDWNTTELFFRSSVANLKVRLLVV